MLSHFIILHPLGKEIRVNDGTPLMDVLHGFGIEFPCGGKGRCGKCRIRILEGEINISASHQEVLTRLGLGPDWRLACYSRCTGNIRLEVEQFNHIILADESYYSFKPGIGYGIAIDLGTTTIVAQLVHLTDGSVIAVETMLNPQQKFGSDLISRIQACLDGNLEKMSGMIRSSIGEMISLLLKNYDGELQEIILVGNTVMQLIFCGQDVTPLSAYPFQTDNLGLKSFDPDELGWEVKIKNKVRFMPSIGSFVGSDILAGIAATGLYKKEKWTALIDLGTNGEIVIGNKKRIICASTAAGPAFEGANISMGMQAVSGAISSLEIINGKMVPAIIGNTTPKGICGSGLIDIVASLKIQNKIGMFGEILSGEKSVSIAGNVSLSQKDINEFLLAKAAIAAGLTILTQHLSIKLRDIDKIYIAGGFGNYINIKNIIATGMVELSEDKIHKMGNTALIGAKMFLFSNWETVEEILKMVKHINLEGNPEFQNIYVDKMLLS